ncbi:MAG: ATP-binding protein, partial [Candidatus Limnocylindria bacterium]
LTPPELSAQLRAAYIAWLRGLAARGPVAVALEDVNWADESSAELAADVMALTDRSPIGLVMTLRPESGTAGWGLRTHALSDFSHRLTNVDLPPLNLASTEELATQLVPGDGLDPGTRRTLAEVSEGNPLFLEELLARLQETGALAHHDAWTLTVPRNVLPPALEGLLVARIDHLPVEVRRVSEAAAVIGRQFSRTILEGVVDEPDAALEALLRAGIIVERGRYPDQVYEFRHGLLQEAVLGTLTDARRAELHLAAARACEARYAAALDSHLEEVAHHYARAHDLGKALEYLERGAERAAELGANEEAGRLWLRALRAANRLNDESAVERIRDRMARVAPDS